MSWRRDLADDLENLMLCVLEDGTTADEIKSMVDDCVEVMREAAETAAENSRLKLVTR